MVLWLPGWVPWCVVVSRVALAGTAILGAPMDCPNLAVSRLSLTLLLGIQVSCCMYTGHREILCKYVCHVMSKCFVASWLGSLVRRC